MATDRHKQFQISNDSDDSDDDSHNLRNLSSPFDMSFHDEDSSHTHHVPLIPADCDSIEEASENFLRVFEARYGDKHPFFNPVPLEVAFNELQSASFTHRKPLLLYLHDDNSVSSQLFCTQVLCNEAMIDCINSNFNLWVWDCSLPENRTKVIEWVEACTSHQVSLKIRVCTHEDYPVLMAFTKTRNGIENVGLIKANCVLADVMQKVLEALDCHNEYRKYEKAEMAERQQRQRVVSEQELAYEESLAADKLKAEQKTLEEKRKKAEEDEKLEKQAKKEDERRRIERQLPAEPPEDSKHPFTTIRIRLPQTQNSEQNTVERRFYMTDTLNNLIDFAATKGYASSEFKLLTTYPKRDLMAENSKKTFKDLKFSPREAVVIEQK